MCGLLWTKNIQRHYTYMNARHTLSFSDCSCILIQAIHGYRETERKHWSEKNKVVIQRIKDLAFPEGAPHLAYVHVLDIEKNGYIKAHVDSVRVCIYAYKCLVCSSGACKIVTISNQMRQVYAYSVKYMQLFCCLQFCGDIIAGISLLSTAVMRLVHTENKDRYADVLVKQRSLYVMK